MQKVLFSSEQQASLWKPYCRVPRCHGCGHSLAIDIHAGKDWASQKARQATEAFQHMSAAQKAAADQAPMTSGMSETAQQQAGKLLHQQLQLLTVDTESIESALLTKLLRVCNVAIQLLTAFTESAEASNHRQVRQKLKSAVTGDKTPPEPLLEIIGPDAASPASLLPCTAYNTLFAWLHQAWCSVTRCHSVQLDVRWLSQCQECQYTYSTAIHCRMLHSNTLTC